MFTLETYRNESLASDRLKKAIERNRVKRAKRERATVSPARKTGLYSSSGRTSTLGTSRATRQSVARQDQFEFLTSVKKRPRKPIVGYKYKSKKAKSNLKLKMQKYLHIAGWIFCLFLVLRLVFADRGVVDFYKRNAHLDKRMDRFQEIRNENSDLEKEIVLIRSSRGYQKKLVRDHLGFIDRDEFLILFAKGSKKKSI